MKTNRRNLVIFAAFLACLGACATPLHQGPGMTVTFNNGIKGKSVDVLRAISSSGTRFPSPGSLAPDANPLSGGATMGAAPDGRELPEWVEFEWKEWPYPYQKMPSKAQALQAWREGVHALAQSLPRKTARVAVRSHIPQDVVNEVMESNRKREPHKLAEKRLRVYFIWYESGIKFRWELQKGCCEVLRAGGDDVGG